MIRAWQQCKNIYHYVQAQAWRLFYSQPDKGMHLYGITGTNGKTTTCYVLDGILTAAYGREKVGMLTTVAMRIGAQEEINKTKMTTLKSRVVFRYLAQMKRAGVTHAVIETTSHALDQHRLSGICFDGAIILNIAREHLDYHGTMEAYAQAKVKIINYLKPGAPLIVKGDDEWIRKVVFPLLTKEGWPRQGGDGVVKFTSAQASSVTTPLPGEVNKENVLAATLLARAVGMPESAVAAGIAAVDHVPGRMEWIEVAGKPRVLIDYAVTPDALERLYKDVRAKTQGKVFGVLGAAGNRDRGKRPDMAAAVARYADYLVLTREDPWTEPEEQIFQDLEKGLAPRRDAGRSEVGWRRIVDRREAIAWCIAQAEAQDTIVVTGKGAEQGMALSSEIVPWQERAVVLELLNVTNP